MSGEDTLIPAVAEGHSTVPRPVHMELLLCSFQAGDGWEVPKLYFRMGLG